MGLIALLIIVMVIVGAIITKRCVEFITFGSLIAALILYKQDFLVEWALVFQEIMGDWDSVWLVLVCGLFGGLIALLQASKGTYGFSGIIEKLCTTERKTLLTSFILGILIFIDDYLNILTVGVCMRDICDRKRIPRETLAYIIDSTGAPVCVLLPFSTWAVFFANLFNDEQAVIDLGYSTAIEAYIQAIPFTFYAIICLVVMFLFVMGWMPKLGSMKTAYKRAKEEGKVYSDASRKFNHKELEGVGETGNIWDFIIPMVVVVVVTVITGDLLFAVIAAVIVCFIMYIPRKVVAFSDYFDVVIKGFCDMIPTLTLVLMAFVFQDLLSTMGLTEYIIDSIQPLLKGSIFPAVVFVLVAFLTFTTGSNWGMSAVVIPIMMPLSAAVGANTILTMGAIISGGTFGSHACFYSDATLLASASCGMDNMEHALSQFPYVLITSALSIIAFLVAGFIM